MNRFHADRRHGLRCHGINPDADDWRQKLEELDRKHQHDFFSTFSARWHNVLDGCAGACPLARSELGAIVARSLLHFDHDRYEMLDFVVMPNHVHLLAAFPTDDLMLTQCESWKHFTAKQINRVISRNGRFWQQDGFDHLVRSDLGDTLHIRFDAAMNKNSDYWYIDDVEVIGTLAAPPDNYPPVVDAGIDQSISDNDATGSESLTIVGSASDPDGTVDSYEWSDGTNVLGTLPALTTNLSVGVHTLTLTATDNEGATGSDSVVITVVANQGPAADAGQDLSVVDADNSGSEVVTVNGSGTDSDGSILSYEWKEGTTPLGNTATVTPNLSVGTHTLTLTVTDNGGATAVDSVNITVSAASSEVVLFEDSFENGPSTDSNNWNGKWVEDGQDDYFRSTQRFTDGVRSAEVDGSASDATLTISSAQDVSNYGYALLTFDWYIESGFDLNEYLSLDISANGGGSWSFDVRRLDGGKGTASSENTWFSEAVDLAPYSSSNLLIRFRTYVSSSREDANIDAVRIVAGSSSAAPMAPGSIVAKSEPQPEPQQLMTDAGIGSLLTHASDSAAAAATQFAFPSLGSAELASMSPTVIDEVLASDGLFDDLALDTLAPRLS